MKSVIMAAMPLFGGMLSGCAETGSSGNPDARPATVPSAGTLVPLDAAPVSEAAFTAFMLGMPQLRGTAFDRRGDAQGAFRAEYKADSAKTVWWTPRRGARERFDVRWEVRDGQWCEERSFPREWHCGLSQPLYRKGDTCYRLRSDGSLQHRFGC